MTKKDRDVLRAQAQRAAGKEVEPEAAAAETQAVTEARANDLDDPKTQAAIELPATIELKLALPEGVKIAAISTEFTHEQVFDWNLFEDLQSFAILIRGELRAAQFTLGDNDAYSAAMTTSRVRTAVRKLLSKITTYKEPWVTKDARGRETRHVRPTEDELRQGIIMDSGEPNLFAMQQLADVLFGMYSNEVERQKNVRTAAVPG